MIGKLFTAAPCFEVILVFSRFLGGGFDESQQTSEMTGKLLAAGFEAILRYEDFVGGVFDESERASE